jgi:uncharacterized membrane protein
MRFSLRTEWPHWLLLAGMFALAATAWSTAPNRIAMHWNLAGQVDRYGGRAEGLLAIPLLALAIYVLMILLPRLDPGRANYAAFGPAYSTLRLLVLVVLAATYVLLHLWMRGVHAPIGIWMPLIVGALFIVVGNLLGKVRPNWFVGIRTPWTLSSKVAWTGTHRAGRWVFILMGALMMSCAALPSAWFIWTMAGAGAAGVLGLVVYSYVLWRGDPEKTPPAGTLPAEDDSGATRACRRPGLRYSPRPSARPVPSGRETVSVPG